MRYCLHCDFLFMVEANDECEAHEKGWDIIKNNLPEQFNTEWSILETFGIDNEKGE